MEGCKEKRKCDLLQGAYDSCLTDENVTTWTLNLNKAESISTKGTCNGSRKTNSKRRHDTLIAKGRNIKERRGAASDGLHEKDGRNRTCESQCGCMRVLERDRTESQRIKRGYKGTGEYQEKARNPICNDTGRGTEEKDAAGNEGLTVIK